MSDEAARKAAYRWCANVMLTSFKNGVRAELAREVQAEVEKIIKAMKNAGEMPETVVVPDTPTNGAPRA